MGEGLIEMKVGGDAGRGLRSGHGQSVTRSALVVHPAQTDGGVAAQAHRKCWIISIRV